MKKIILNRVKPNCSNYKKYVALVDDEDYEKVNQYNWSVVKPYGDIRYATTLVDKKRVYLHRFIMNSRYHVDHIDHNGLNCQRSNMRECTHHQNMMNKRPHKDSKCRYKGVHLEPSQSNKWITQCGGVYLGTFAKEKEAAKAYNIAAKKLYGKFAYLNKI